MKLEDVSHAVSHALRHEPEKYGLALDPQGWVELDDLVRGLRSSGRGLKDVTTDDLFEMMATAKKQRFEVDGSRIRAFYGHSVEADIERPAVAPPDVLFHGTSPESWASIQTEGLRPMSRQSVHLSVDEATARLVGSRKTKQPMLLRVDAKAAHEAGVVFALGNENVWVATAIPPGFLRPL